MTKVNWDNIVCQPLTWEEETFGKDYHRDHHKIKTKYDFDHIRKNLDKIISVDVINKEISINHDVGIMANMVYSYLQDMFDEPSFMQYQIPMIAQTPELYTFINGYRIREEDQFKIRYSAWQYEWDEWKDELDPVPQHTVKFYEGFNGKSRIYREHLYVMSEFRLLGNRPPNTTIEYMIHNDKPQNYRTKTCLSLP